MRYFLSTLLLFVGGASFGQQAGYRNMVLTDTGRLYKPGTVPGQRLYYRPIELDCWYPADIEKGTTLPARDARIPFGAFLELFQQRANSFQEDTVYSGLAGETARYFCAGFGIPDTAALTGLPTRSYRNGRPVHELRDPGPSSFHALRDPASSSIHERFPLIVYMCSYNGMCYENIPLFEELARRGYVVVSITSVGRYPGNMTMDEADLKEQVADGLFAIHTLSKSEMIDTTKIGLIGYSWGGPAALLLAGETSVAAVLSLDGSELHYYGHSRDDDNQFDGVRADLLRSAKGRFAYGYLESDGKQNDGPADSLFNLLPGFPGVKKYVRYPGTSHEDFSCLPYLAAVIRKRDTATLPDYPGFAVKWFDNYLRNGANQLPGDSPYPVVVSPSVNVTAISATVVDAEDRSLLAYVYVGIPGKDIGTITRDDGGFRLDVDPQFEMDSLVFSMAGYEKQYIRVKDIPAVILLRRRSGSLKEAVVTAGARRKKILGNKTTSSTVGVGFPTRFLGAEIGVKMSLGKTPRRLETFRCHIYATRVDSAVFRLNIYRLTGGSPENILERNVFLSVGKTPGDYSIDLSGLDLALSGDILVSLELVRSYSAVPGPGAVYFSAALFNSGTWRRQTSQAEWKKAHGFGVGFNVEVR